MRRQVAKPALSHKLDFEIFDKNCFTQSYKRYLKKYKFIVWSCNCAYILFRNNRFFFNFQEKNKQTKLDKASFVAVG